MVDPVAGFVLYSGMGVETLPNCDFVTQRGTSRPLPDVVTVGGAARLVSLRAVAREFSTTVARVRRILTALGVDTLTTESGDGDYVHLWALEKALCRFWDPTLTDSAIMELGGYYKSLSREGIRNHLDVILRKARQVRSRLGHAQTVKTRTLRKTTPSQPLPASPEQPPSVDAPGPVSALPAPGSLPSPGPEARVDSPLRSRGTVPRGPHEAQVVGSTPTSAIPMFPTLGRFGG